MFFNMREKSGRTDQFGDVMMIYLPPFVQTVAEMVADTSTLHHQIDQAFPIFSRALKNMGRPGYEASLEGHSCLSMIKGF